MRATEKSAELASDGMWIMGAGHGENAELASDGIWMIDVGRGEKCRISHRWTRMNTDKPATDNRSERSSKSEKVPG
jgi:hypothetical protein